MSTATPDDVDLDGGGVIATDLTDAQIQSFIDDAEYEAKAVINGYQDWEDEDKRQREKYYAALLIRENADRAINSTSRETASVDYEGMSLNSLKRAVDKRDPTGTLASNTDTNRYVGSTHTDS